MPNKARKELIKALESNSGYSSGSRHHTSYAIAFNVKVYCSPDQALVLQSVKENTPTGDLALLQSKGFDLNQWVEGSLERVDSDCVIEAMRMQVTDFDGYSYPNGSEKQHKVEFGFTGRSGGYLVVTEFNGKSLELSNDDLIEQLQLLDNTNEETADSHYSNQWCRDLLIMLNQWENNFSRDNVNNAYSYEVGFQLSQRLEEMIESIHDADKVEYWNSRDIQTKGEFIMIKSFNFTRVKNDVNGNPRYVCHFLHCVPSAHKSETWDIAGQYNAALATMKPLGGKRFHNKQYGGGIVFSTYNLQDLCNKINAITGQSTNA